MASSQQVLALIRSHAAGDSDQFFSVAEHVADDAARSGKNRVADEIRSTVARVRPAPNGRTNNRPVPIATPLSGPASVARVESAAHSGGPPACR